MGEAIRSGFEPLQVVFHSSHCGKDFIYAVEERLADPILEEVYLGHVGRLRCLKIAYRAL